MSENNYKKTTDNIDVAMEAATRVQYWNHHVAGAKTLITPTNGVQGEEGGRAAKRPVAGMTKSHASYAMGTVEAIERFYTSETLVRGAAQQLATSYMQSLDADSPRTKEALLLLADTQEEKDEITNMYENGWHISGNPNGGGRFVFQCARDAAGNPIQFNSMAVKLEKNETNSITDLFELRGSMWDGSEDYKAEYDLLAGSPHSPGVVYTQRNEYPEEGPMELPKVLQRIWEMGSKEVVRTLVEKGFTGLKNAATVEKTEAPAKLAKATAKATKTEKSVRGDASSAEEVVREYCLSNNDQFVEILTGYGYVVHPDHAEGINADKARVVGDYIIVDGVFQTKKASDKTDYAVDVILPLSEEDPINYLRLMVRNSNDPLSMSRGTYGDQPANLFDAYVAYEHNGNHSAAVRAAAKEMGVDMATVLADYIKSLKNDADLRAKFIASMPFKCVGQHTSSEGEGHILYSSFINRNGKMVRYSSMNLGSRSIQTTLAQSEEWALAIGDPTRKTWDLSDAKEILEAACADKGDGSKKPIKKPGFHKDGADWVYHQGRTLYINGESTPVMEYEGENQYETTDQTEDLAKVDPFTPEEYSTFLNHMGMITTSNAIEKHYAMGWAATALVGTAINWRTALWLTSPGGWGKSAIIDDYYIPLLGRNIEKSTDTTVAALHGNLNGREIATVIEEAESKNLDTERIEELIKLTTTKDGKRSRASSNGAVKTTYAAFQLCFASTVQMELDTPTQQRIAVVNVTKPDAAKGELYREDNHRRTIIALSLKFRKHVIDNVSRLLDTIAAIRLAIVTAMGGAQGGDNVLRYADRDSTLLGGSYFLHNHTTPTQEEALEFVEQLGIREHLTITEVVTAENQMLSNLMNVCVEGHGTVEYLYMKYKNSPDSVTDSEAKALSEVGIRIMRNSANGETVLCVERKNDRLRKLMTEDGQPYDKLLLRTPGASVTKQAIVRGSSPKNALFVAPPKA